MENTNEACSYSQQPNDDELKNAEGGILPLIIATAAIGGTAFALDKATDDTTEKVKNHLLDS